VAEVIENAETLLFIIMWVVLNNIKSLIYLLFRLNSGIITHRFLAQKIRLSSHAIQPFSLHDTGSV